MAKLIKCPRCQSQIDVTNVSGGATVRCPDCGAMVRVPTGQTGQYPKVGAQAPQPAAAAARGGTKARVGGGRQTELFRRMSGVRAPGAAGRPPSRSSVEAEDRRTTGVRRSGGNNALIGIGAGVGALALIGILIFSMNSKADKAKAEKESKATKRAAATAESKRQAERDAAEAAAEAAAQQAAAKDAGKKGASLVKKAGGNYDVPATFEPGARKQADRTSRDPITLPIDEKVNKEYEELAGGNKIADILREDSKWMPYIINGIVSDNEAVARGSYQALHDFCEKQKLSSSEEGFRNPVKLELFNSAYARGGEFNYWSEWYLKPSNRDELKARGGKGAGADNARVVGEDPARAKWDEIMQYLRAGGGFDDPKRPEGAAYRKVQAMGRGAYPYIVKYIDHEDVLLGRAAVTVLNALTERKSTLPTEATKSQIKTEWENWVKNNP